jgi:5-epi-alpha-selinene synthase
MEHTERVVLPELYCPFSPAISEHADAIHTSTVEWAQRFDLTPGWKASKLFDATGIGYLVARTHPDAALDELRLISDWYAWLFLQDDMRDESETGKRPDELSSIDDRFLDILEGAELGILDEPLTCALHDLRERLGERLRVNVLSDVWMRRFVRTVRGHLEATLWEATNRRRLIVPELDSYVRMRPMTGGLSIVTELVEIVEGVHLPAEVREHRTVVRLTEASHNVVCWANDILSLAKELRTGEVNNLIVVLRGEYGLTLQQAIDLAAEMHDAEVIDFVHASTLIPSFGAEVDGALDRYVAALRARMRGVLDWAYESGRYGATSSRTFTISANDLTTAHRSR